MAVSGGSDSLALLLLANAALPEAVEAATVDHQLRPESAGEAAMVARLCAEIEVPHVVVPVEVEPGNLQASARAARYEALSRWAKDRDLDAVATAHHADDQAETLLMRLNRGSGVAGLAGVRERGFVPGSDVPLLRPLLGWRRADLAQVVGNAGLTAVDDPSNSDQQFERARVRAALLANEWLDGGAIAASAQNLADAEEALEHYFQFLLARDAFADRGIAGFRNPHARQMQFMLCRWAIAEFGKVPRGKDVARLVERLRAGKSGNVAGVLARVDGANWVFEPEPPRRT